MRRNHLTIKEFSLVFVVLALGIFSIYSNIFEAPFVFDDIGNIVENNKIKNLSNLWPPVDTRYITYLTFSLNYYIGGLDPFGYHLVNIIIHLANSVIVFLLVLTLFKTPWVRSTKTERLEEIAFAVAVTTALVFAFHPVHTSAVTYVTQRFAALATAFYILSLLLYLRWRLAHYSDDKHLRRSLIYLLPALAAALCAQATKEISFTLPFVIVLFEFVFYTGRIGKRILYLTPFLVTLITIPVLFLASSYYSDASVSAITEINKGFIADEGPVSRYSYLITEFRVIFTYFRLMLFPINQHLDYAYPLFETFLNPRVFISFTLLLALILFSIYLFIKSRREKNLLYLLMTMGVFWFFITISIESSIIPLFNDVIFEHRLYLPSIGFILSLSTLLLYVIFSLKKKLALKRSVMSTYYTILVLILIALSVTAYSRNMVWQSARTLWEDSVAKSPEKPRPHYNLGVIYSDEGLFEKAKIEFRTVIDLYPASSTAHNNLGNIYYLEGKIMKAFYEYKDALKYDPDNIEANYNLGNIYESLGNIKESRKYYRIFIENATPSYSQQVYEVKSKIMPAP